MLTACRITLAELRAVYGNLERSIHAVSNRGTLFTVSNKPRNRMRRTGREKVSRNPFMNSYISLFLAVHLSLVSVRRHCHWLNDFQANATISSLPCESSPT